MSLDRRGRFHGCGYGRSRSFSRRRRHHVKEAATDSLVAEGMTEVTLEVTTEVVALEVRPIPEAMLKGGRTLGAGEYSSSLIFEPELMKVRVLMALFPLLPFAQFLQNGHDFGTAVPFGDRRRESRWRD